MKDVDKIRQLIVHLRSGKYDQCEGRLHETGTNNFCCLGVMTHAVNGISKSEIGSDPLSDVDEGMQVYVKDIYSELEDYFKGVFNNLFVLDECVSMNDSGCPFDEIADFIEQELGHVIDNEKNKKT